LDILTFTAAPRSNGVTYHGQNTSEIEVKRWPYRRNLPGGARVAHHIHIDEGFSSHSRAALRLRAKGLNAQANAVSGQIGRRTFQGGPVCNTPS
jgi:hypothetical protein